MQEMVLLLSKKEKEREILFAFVSSKEIAVVIFILSKEDENLKSMELFMGIWVFFVESKRDNSYVPIDAPMRVMLLGFIISRLFFLHWVQKKKWY